MYIQPTCCGFLKRLEQLKVASSIPTIFKPHREEEFILKFEIYSARYGTSAVVQAHSTQAYWCSLCTPRCASWPLWMYYTHCTRHAEQQQARRHHYSPSHAPGPHPCLQVARDTGPVRLRLHAPGNWNIQCCSPCLTWRAAEVSQLQRCWVLPRHLLCTGQPSLHELA